MYEYANARDLLQAGRARRVTSTTAQASTIAMATVNVLARTRVSVQRAGVDRAVSSRHAGQIQLKIHYITCITCKLSIFCLKHLRCKQR